MLNAHSSFSISFFQALFLLLCNSFLLLCLLLLWFTDNSEATSFWHYTFFSEGSHVRERSQIVSTLRFLWVNRTQSEVKAVKLLTVPQAYQIFDLTSQPPPQFEHSRNPIICLRENTKNLTQRRHKNLSFFYQFRSSVGWCFVTIKIKQRSHHRGWWWKHNIYH